MEKLNRETLENTIKGIKGDYKDTMENGVIGAFGYQDDKYDAIHILIHRGDSSIEEKQKVTEKFVDELVEKIYPNVKEAVEEKKKGLAASDDFDFESAGILMQGLEMNAFLSGIISLFMDVIRYGDEVNGVSSEDPVLKRLVILGINAGINNAVMSKSALNKKAFAPDSPKLDKLLSSLSHRLAVMHLARYMSLKSLLDKDSSLMHMDTVLNAIEHIDDDEIMNDTLEELNGNIDNYIKQGEEALNEYFQKSN